MFKKWFLGFTLAEVMIVLTVIGILAGILIPVANNSRPDENVMKFKKAHATLANVIHELVTSDKYYKGGDLGIKPDGSQIYGGFTNCSTGTSSNSDSNILYFCRTFADNLSTKSVNCSSAKTGEDNYFTYVAVSALPTAHTWVLSLEDAKSTVDNKCKASASTVGAEIVTSDDIIYYQANPQATFGIVWVDYDVTRCARLFGSMELNGFDPFYKIFCIDIDGINKGEDPFGYGIRADGKILTGARADEWLEKDFQKGKNEN